MSKIAEKKALEEYPEVNPPYRTNIEAQVNVEHAYKREGYIKGYDQAMQDFMEKAEKWLEPTFKNIAGYNCGGDLMNNFKNYMQDEM